MQTRDEWLQHRHKGIGSSDAAAIHAESPYTTPYDLWSVKILDKYEEKETSFVMQRGNDMEPIARQRFAAVYNIENGTEETFEPRLIQMADLPWMKASLDGSSSDGKTIVEFKLQGAESHADTLKGNVRRHYWIQCQHQLLVSGAEVCYFASFDGASLHTIRLLPDTEWMKIHLSACVSFWERVQTKTPPPFTAKDYKELRVKGAKALAREYLRLREEMNRAGAELIGLCGDKPRYSCEGLKIENGVIR